MGTTRTIGSTPTKNRICQPLQWPQKFSLPSTMPMLTPEARMLPTADSDCMTPRANVRKRGVTLSASRVVAEPNMPPTPKPHRKR